MIDLPFPTLASHLVLAGRVIALDAGNLMAASLGATAIGGGISAGGTLAGGSYAAAAGRAQNQAAQFEAGQIDSNAGQAIASGQRQMMDTEQRTRLAESSAIARAGASGVSADVGSPAAITGSIASRGSYQAMMDMFNGQSTATGLENRCGRSLRRRARRDGRRREAKRVLPCSWWCAGIERGRHGVDLRPL